MNNIPQEFSTSLTKSIRSADNIDKPVRISAQQLHKYVLGLISVFVLAIVSYPISMNRVAQKEKFASYNSHLKSLTIEYRSIDRK